MSAVELFVHLRGDDGRTCGYHYSAYGHELRPISPSSVDLSRLGAGIALCVGPDRLAVKYTNFALRLAFLQAGHAMGAMRHVAGILGADWGRTLSVAAERVEECFDLRPAGLGCVAWIGTGSEGSPWPAPIGDRTPASLAQWRGVPDAPADAHSEYQAVLDEIRDGAESLNRRVTAAPSSLDEHQLAQAERDLHRRTSGDLRATAVGIHRRELGADTVADYLSDIASWPGLEDPGWTSCITVLCRVVRAARSTVGSYLFEADRREFVRSRSTPASPFPDHVLGNRRFTTARDLSFVWVISADYRRARGMFGASYYLALNLAAGDIGQGICTVSARYGLAARPMCDFDDAELDRWTGPGFASSSPTYVVAVAPARRGIESRLDWSARHHAGVTR